MLGILSLAKSMYLLTRGVLHDAGKRILGIRHARGRSGCTPEGMDVKPDLFDLRVIPHNQVRQRDLRLLEAQRAASL